jgi:Transposase DDE domain
MSKKAVRPIRNWSEYTDSLKKRGDLTIWFSQEAVAKWYEPHTGKRGRPHTFSDYAIMCALTIRCVFRLSLRETQGFIESLIKLMGLDLECPDYTTFCRRARFLKAPMPKVADGPVDLVFDGSGIKFFGPGEWQRRKHGVSKRRRWRKIHIGLNPSTHQIMVVGFTTQDVHDCQVLPGMLSAYPGEIGEVIADGAYDTKECYQAIFSRGGSPLIPPRKGAKPQPGNDPYLTPRDEAIDRIIRQKRGKKRWKIERGYHRRSLVETAYSRLKCRLGDRLSARRFDNQAIEVFTRISALNRMADLGMPERREVAA